MDFSRRSYLCRLCLCSDDSFACIFEHKAFHEQNIASILRELFQFKVSENDGYPKFICSSCLRKIKEFQIFKEGCMKAMITYDAEVRPLENENINQELEVPEIVEMTNGVIKHECNSDHLDAFGNLLTKEESPLPEDEEVSLVNEIDVDEIKYESGVSQVEEKEDTFSEENFDEEVPIEIVEHPVKIEPANGKDYEHQTAELPVPKPVDGFIGGEIHHNTGHSTVFIKLVENGRLTAPEDHVPKNTNNKCVPNDILYFTTKKSPLVSTVNLLQNSTMKKPCKTVCTVNVEHKMQKYGDKSKVYICDVCGKKTYRKQDMALHVRVHSGARPYGCSMCPRYFSQPGNLINHQKIHLGQRDYSCDQCKKAYVTKSNLRKHQKIHSTEWRYLCHECGSGFHYKRGFQKHVQTHTASKTNTNENALSRVCKSSVDNKKKGFECTICRRVLRNKHTLAIHLRIHSGDMPFTCAYCNKTFACETYLKTHKKRHLGVRNYSCNQCPKKFLSSSELSQHKLYHRKILRFFCNECSKGFVKKSELVIHLRSHTGLKPFKCSVCNASFSQMTNLKTHSLTHMTIKPFTCDVCKRYFQSSAIMRKHICMEYTIDGYSCGVCSRKFKAIRSLRSHEKYCKKRSC